MQPTPQDERTFYAMSSKIGGSFPPGWHATSPGGWDGDLVDT
jgi:hypothetical protein